MKNSSNWAPQHAIWFQRIGDVTAYVSLVNDVYQFEIFSKHGSVLDKGDRPSLFGAKAAVLLYFRKFDPTITNL